MKIIKYRSSTVYIKKCDNIVGSKIELKELDENDISSENSPLIKKKYTAFLNRKKQGNHFFGFKKNDTLIAYFWLSKEHKKVPIIFDTEFIVPKNSIYIWDCKTRDSYRNQGIFTKGIRFLAALGWAKNLLIAANNDNYASKKVMENLKLDKYISLWSLRIFNYTLITKKKYFK